MDEFDEAMDRRDRDASSVVLAVFCILLVALCMWIDEQRNGLERSEKRSWEHVSYLDEKSQRLEVENIELQERITELETALASPIVEARTHE